MSLSGQPIANVSFSEASMNHTPGSDNQTDGDREVSVECVVPPNDVVGTSEEPKGGKKRSWVWAEFEVKTLGDGTQKAYYVHCRRDFNPTSKHGTSHLGNHLKSCKKRKYKSTGQTLITSVRTPNEPPKLANWSYDPRVSRLDFARMIAKHDYPFNMAQHDYFRVFIRRVNPMYKFYTRQTVTGDVMGIYNEEKEKLQEFFDNLSSRVSLTTDLWTSNYQPKGYCCITCHYIDDDWKLQKKIIAYQVVRSPHTGLALSEVLRNQMLYWNIDKKMFAITVDNASNNNVMVGGLKSWLCTKEVLYLNGDLFHIRCSAHILNLIVQEGLEEIRHFVNEIRESVKYTKGSQNRNQKFVDALNHTKLKGKSVIQDVPTRWNSTYEMLQSAIEVRPAFERLHELDDDYHHLPSEVEWEIGNTICQCLKKIYDVTHAFSGTQYPTANLYFKGVCDVHQNILAWLTHEKECVRNMATRMKNKFDDYWSTSSLLMCIGCVLDPCYKMAFVDYAFEAIYGKRGKKPLVEFVEKSLKELYTVYAKSDPSIDEDMDSSTVVGSSSGGSSILETSKIQEGFRLFMKQRSRRSHHAQKTELDKYLEDDCFPLDDNGKGCDILNWWRLNGPKYPTLARMARDILAVPVSTVASESTFSGGGRIITQDRSSLGADIVEALVCLKDWMPSTDVSDIVELEA